MEKKKMKFGTKILIVVLMILFIFIITTTRKFLILRQIAIQNEADIQSTNFYSKTYDIVDGITELWIYGKKSMLKYTSIEENKFIERTIYVDKDNEEGWIIVNEPEKKTAVQIEYNEDVELMPCAETSIGLPTSDEIWKLIQMAVITNIEDTKWNGKEAYKVTFNCIETEEYSIWIDKEENRVTGQMNGTSTDENGNIYNHISTYHYQFDTLTKEDVELPDLTGYTIKNENENIIEK